MLSNHVGNATAVGRAQKCSEFFIPSVVCLTWPRQVKLEGSNALDMLKNVLGEVGDDVVFEDVFQRTGIVCCRSPKDPDNVRQTPDGRNPALHGWKMLAWI